ncbi:MAG TPA: hypothetical protein PLD47_05835 [Aggregatilineales bacterium]|nr:hypothetical protein [Anaerolineales bacterium]HRE47228.1 hypothetical protein [Aggregatilineales bacterium]
MTARTPTPKPEETPISTDSVGSSELPSEVTIPEIIVDPKPRRGDTSILGAARTEGVEVFIAPDTVIDEARLRTLTDPFRRSGQARPPASEIIRPDAIRNTTMLRQFVTQERLNALWKKIEDLQREVVKHVTADRTNTDAYQLDLLFASSLLLQSSANYEEARQIAYRIESDLAREDHIRANIIKYRPRLLAYYLICALIVLLAFSLDANYRALVPDTLGILKMAWLPIMFGALGAIFNGMMAIHEHTTIEHNFDPIHVSWYILNPFMGAIMGIVVLIFFAVTSNTFNTQTPDYSQSAPLVIWLLAFAVGWQQNLVFRLLNRFLKTFLGDDKTAQRTPASQVTVAPPSGISPMDAALLNELQRLRGGGENR